MWRLLEYLHSILCFQDIHLKFQSRSHFFKILSHNSRVAGDIMKYIKYIIVNICPVVIYGVSTGRAPIQVNKIKVANINQNNTWFSG